MRSFDFAVVVGLLSILPSSASAQPFTSPACAAAGLSPVELNEFYAKRAIQILADASDNKTEALALSVNSEASFSFWQGDYGTTFSNGVPGILKLSRRFKPTRYQIATKEGGLNTYVTPVCKWTTTVIFRTEKPGEAVSMKFQFVDGLLTLAEGYGITLLESDVRFPPQM
jgi:hypothetical protein